MPKSSTVFKTEECPYLNKLKEMLEGEKPIEYFADDDYIYWIEFIKRQRQDLCRLFSGIPKDHPSRKISLDAIKGILDRNSKNGLQMWYRSDFSTREICDYAAKLLKEKFNHVVD